MKLFLNIAIVLTFTLGFSQDFDKKKLDNFFNLIEKHEKGMNSFSIFKNGKEVYQKSIGYENLEKKIKPSANTKYRIASVSKMFTATIIMKLVAEEKLTLDTKLSNFFPEIKYANNISIEQMLRHGSGIYNITSARDYALWMEKPISKQGLVDKISSFKPSFYPGTKYGYSNSNYILLTFIIEKITKLEFRRVLSDMICKPCGLESTYYGEEIGARSHEAYSYLKLDQWELQTETDMSIPQGAGGIVSNPTDLNTFINCLFNHKLVAEASLELMKEIKGDKYGIGMMPLKLMDKKAYGHNGEIDGFGANVSYLPEENISVAYASNGKVMKGKEIVLGALKIYFNKNFEFPNFTKKVEITPEELIPYLGVYSRKDFPLKISISKRGNKLYGKATGQSPFPLEPQSKNYFKFEPASIEIIFDLKESQLTLKQKGGRLVFKKE